MDKFELRNSNFEILLCERRVSAVKYYFGCNESRWAFRGDEVNYNVRYCIGFSVGEYYGR
jgi:hypothetical protein